MLFFLFNIYAQLDFLLTEVKLNRAIEGRDERVWSVCCAGISNEKGFSARYWPLLFLTENRFYFLLSGHVFLKYWLSVSISFRLISNLIWNKLSLILIIILFSGLGWLFSHFPVVFRLKIFRFLGWFIFAVFEFVVFLVFLPVG